ncbi:YdcF family protein [Synechococcales cyanobacterium C]|uniref:YdcF family protein n=1 Tax=Petrachloros mirabilis ULC683 TaxID=2781853 RepID=A0A8K2A686_9CYAN|nr:YdcF family protein [Petrachloros mirabilis]NCJ05154.1 YdcF family protein [Petrachloros mirabilis ULC683]
MFLWLSKLLPLFLYPVGLTCVLLGVAIAAFWKFPQLAALAVTVALSIQLIAANPWVARTLTESLERQHLPPDPMPSASAIVILGGGIQPQRAPRPWVEVSEAGDRVLYGAKLYREGKAPRVILSGGRIDWRHGGRAESKDMAELIQTMGVPASALWQDKTSLNTRENAVNVKQILDTQTITGSILLVTSATHMPRALAIFEKLGIDAIASPTDFQVTQADQDLSWAGFIFELLPNSQALDQTTRALKEYLGWGVYWLRGWI